MAESGPALIKAHCSAVGSVEVELLGHQRGLRRPSVAL